MSGRPPSPTYGKPLSPERNKFFRSIYPWRKRSRSASFSHHRDIPFDDALQIAREGAWKAARLAKDIDTLSFAENFVAKNIWRSLNGHYFHPLASVRDARENEVLASTPAAAKDSEADRTVLNMAADELAEREIAADPGADRLNSRLADLRKAIARLPGLDCRERRALRLRFVLGLDQQAAAARMGFCRSVPKGDRTFRRPETPRSLRLGGHPTGDPPRSPTTEMRTALPAGPTNLIRASPGGRLPE